MALKTGYVAMLDILGFTEQVMRDPSGTDLDKYIGVVRDVASSYTTLKYILFSDTVVLYTLDDRPERFRLMTRICSHLMYRFIEMEIPLRGAIAHGSFARSEDEYGATVIAGRPVIEAYQDEVRQEWIGILLSTSVLRKEQVATDVIANLDPADEDGFGVMKYDQWQEESLPLLRTTIPVHQAGDYEGVAVLPRSSLKRFSVDDLIDDCSMVIEKLTWLKRLAPDPRSQAKYTRSIAWLNELIWQMRTRSLRENP